MRPIETDPMEGLVRQALAGTPAAVPTTDPLAALDRRVRRARRRLAAGAGVVAATVAAAVVIPLVVLGGHGAPNRVGIAHHTPTPAPSVTGPAGTTPLFQSGAISVSADTDGRRWLLYSGGQQTYVGRVIPGGVDRVVKVESPADYVVAGDNVIWVVGAGVAGDDMSRLTAIDTRTGDVSTLPLLHEALSFAVAAEDSLYVDRIDATGGHVDVYNLRNGRILTVDSTSVPDPGEIALSQNGHVWVQSGKKLVELVATGGSTVDWPGDIYGPTGVDATGDSLWAYDGRIIGLTPKSLLGCVSCAEGWRINVAGPPAAVVTAKDGGLFAAVPQTSPAGRRAGFNQGLYYYPPEDVHGSGAITGPSLDGVVTNALVVDPAGGVDYVDDLGRLMRWDPAAAGTR